MRLIRFTTTNDVNVLVNPDTVMCVYDTDEGVWIAFGNDCSYHIQGTLDEVAAKLMGESLTEEPGPWTPKEWEDIYVAAASGGVLNGCYCDDWLELYQAGRVFPWTKEGHKAAFEKAHELRWGSATQENS